MITNNVFEYDAYYPIFFNMKLLYSVCEVITDNMNSESTTDNSIT